MTLRLVRCPECRQRFNVAGMAAGSRIVCAFCAAPLRVPLRRSVSVPPVRRSRPLIQILVASSVGFLLALGAYFLLRPESAVPTAFSPAVADKGPAKPAMEPEDDIFPVHMDHIPPEWKRGLAEARQDLYCEFSSLNLMVVYPFLLAVESGPTFVETELIDDYAYRLRILHETFNSEFGDPLELDRVDRVLPVVILNSRKSYDEYNRRHHGRPMPPEITGMYEYGRRRIILYHDTYAPYEVVFHEGTHQLLHHYSGENSRTSRTLHSYWFEEGMGTYFEGFCREGNRILLKPERNRMRLPTVRESLRENADPSFVPLSRLVKMSLGDFWRWYNGRDGEESRAVLAQLYYAESWALIHFMMHGDSGRYRQAFLRIFRDELRGRGSIALFEKALEEEAEVDLAEFQGAFVDYVRQLK